MFWVWGLACSYKILSSTKEIFWDQILVCKKSHLALPIFQSCEKEILYLKTTWRTASYVKRLVLLFIKTQLKIKENNSNNYKVLFKEIFFPYWCLNINSFQANFPLSKPLKLQKTQIFWRFRSTLISFYKSPVYKQLASDGQLLRNFRAQSSFFKQQ